MQKCRIEFLPHNKSIQVARLTTVRDAALALGIVIQSPCGGAGTCGKCKVWVEESGVSPLSLGELDQLTEKEVDDGMRLSCSAEITADVKCVVPESSIVTFADEQILTAGIAGSETRAPDLCKLVLQPDVPVQGMKYFDAESVLNAIRSSGKTVKPCSLDVLQKIPSCLRKENFTITAVLDRHRLLTVEAGDTSQVLFGISVDIGTTTIAAKLVNLVTAEALASATCGNDQAAYGADVIARISYTALTKDGLKRLHGIVIEHINCLIKTLARQAGIETDNIYKIVLAGNTVMQHIALNVDPVNLGRNPYTPAFQGPVCSGAKKLALQINDAGSVYIVPNLGGYVGGDISALLSILDLETDEDTHLAIDIGTNGEIVLGNSRRLVCCSSPAGPAWEGAKISHGVRAVAGAIERISIVGAELEIHTIGNMPAIGICGSGLFDLVCELYRVGIIDASGRLLPAENLKPEVPEPLCRRIRKSKDGGYEIRIAGTEDGGDIVLTQKDIRELQLAKATIVAGIKVLLSRLQITPGQIGQVYIAGAFGNHIREKDVIDIGLLPKQLKGRIQFIGNAALSGAQAILSSQSVCKKAESLSQKIEYVEVAGREDFQEYYIEAMRFGMQ